MNDGYSICFNRWALDRDIKNELGLLLIISSLCAERGYCFASNSYLANLFETNESTISRKLKLLESKNYITIEYTKRGNEIISRNIRLSNLITDRYQKCQPTVIKNDKENNISINNISKNNIYSKPTLEEIENYVKEKQLKVNAKSFFEYFEAGDWKDSKGNKVKSWKQKILTWEKFNNAKEDKQRPSTERKGINFNQFYSNM